MTATATATELQAVLAGYEHFGVCPECGKNDGYVNVNRAHFFVCDTHKVFWSAGGNLFSSWRDQTEADWQHNANLLDGYREVQPKHPKLLNNTGIQPWFVKVRKDDCEPRIEGRCGRQV